MCHGRLATAAIDFRKRKNAIHVRTAPHRTTSKQHYMQLNLACIRKFMIWCLWSWAPSLASVRSEFLLLLLESQLLIAGCLRNFRAKRTFSIFCHAIYAPLWLHHATVPNLFRKPVRYARILYLLKNGESMQMWYRNERKHPNHPLNASEGLCAWSAAQKLSWQRSSLQHVWEMQKQWKIHVVFEMPTKWHESKWNQ